ncbi:MAG: PhoH family protein [Planctomycetales bacterium]|nr:PhoH family protein [Planctomycetales bacterium]
MARRKSSRGKTAGERRKLFVLDTNVPLHDANCWNSFQEHDLAIPIAVLEELDQFKKGHQDINFQAREFLRRLDSLTGDVTSDEGASIGEGRGSMRVVLGEPLDERLRTAFLHDCPDHRIVNCALHLTETVRDRDVVLVSKDTNVRTKARAFGITAEDYIRDKVESIDKLYTGRRFVETSDDLVDRFYQADGILAVGEAPEIDEPVANENFVIRGGSKSALATYHAADQTLRRVEKMKAYGITPRNSEQSFALAALTDPSIRLVTLVGKAGTGKTLLALAAALHVRSTFRQILLARPIVPLSNKDIGFLPGDVSAKLDPYMQPLYDNLGVIRHQFDQNDPDAQRINQMLENEKLLITPLAYIRGRSLQKIYFIVDEAQNLTPHEVKTIITRAGEGTKIVFTGDIHQIDHPYLDTLSNGLSYLINRMVGQPIYSHITLEKGERSELADLASQLL